MVYASFVELCTIVWGHIPAKKPSFSLFHFLVLFLHVYFFLRGTEIGIFCMGQNWSNTGIHACAKHDLEFFQLLQLGRRLHRELKKTF